MTTTPESIASTWLADTAHEPRMLAETETQLRRLRAHLERGTPGAERSGARGDPITGWLHAMARAATALDGIADIERGDGRYLILVHAGTALREARDALARAPDQGAGAALTARTSAMQASVRDAIEALHTATWLTLTPPREPTDRACIANRGPVALRHIELTTGNDTVLGATPYLGGYQEASIDIDASTLEKGQLRFHARTHRGCADQRHGAGESGAPAQGRQRRGHAPRDGAPDRTHLRAPRRNQPRHPRRRQRARAPRHPRRTVRGRGARRLGNRTLYASHRRRRGHAGRSGTDRRRHRTRTRRDNARAERRPRHRQRGGASPAHREHTRARRRATHLADHRQRGHALRRNRTGRGRERGRQPARTRAERAAPRARHRRRRRHSGASACATNRPSTDWASWSTRAKSRGASVTPARRPQHGAGRTPGQWPFGTRCAHATTGTVCPEDFTEQRIAIIEIPPGEPTTIEMEAHGVRIEGEQRRDVRIEGQRTRDGETVALWLTDADGREASWSETEQRCAHTRFHERTDRHVDAGGERARDRPRPARHRPGDPRRARPPPDAARSGRHRQRACDGAGSALHPQRRGPRHRPGAQSRGCTMRRAPERSTHRPVHATRYRTGRRAPSANPARDGTTRNRGTLRDELRRNRSCGSRHNRV